MSDAPTHYEDLVRDGVRVLTRYDAEADRWTTVVIGGPLDTWSAVYREDDADPVVEHVKAIEAARAAPVDTEPTQG